MRPSGNAVVASETRTCRVAKSNVASALSRILYNYFRDYDPQTGRYVESDPIGLRGGVNTYGYVKARPIGLVDPFGLVDWTGSATSFSLISGVGATLTFFSLESECACGKKISVDITAVGPSVGLGLKVTGGASAVTFKDPWPCPDENSLSGLFLTGAAGISFGAIPNPNNPRIGTGLPGLGLGASYTQMGDAISIGWPPGYSVGRDKSISATLGSATVMGVKVKSCCNK